MIVRPIAPRREKDRELVGVEAEFFGLKHPPVRRAQHLQVRTRQHQITAHARFFRRDPLLDRVVRRRRRARKIPVDRRLDPVARVAPATGKFPAVGRAAHAVGAERGPRELKIAAVETVVHAEHEVRLVVLQDLQIIAGTKRDVAPIEPTQQLDEGVKPAVHPRGQPLDAIVKTHARAVHHRRFLQHLLDAHVDVVPVKLKTPLGKRLRPRVVTTTGAGCENKNTELGHAVRKS